MTNIFAEQAQKARDLRVQLNDLAQDTSNDQEMQFTEWSPGRKLVKLWSMADGTEIEIPRYMVMNALTKHYKNGYLFTAVRSEAPAFKDGHVKCFLAEGSPERESGLLEAAGLDHLPFCEAVHLRSAWSKRIHAQNRHVQSWEILKEHIEAQEKTETRSEQRKQTEAILSLAGSRAEKPLNEHTNAQLRNIAAERGIDISFATNKAQLINAIESN